MRMLAIRMLTILVTGTLVLGACGDDDDAASTDDTPVDVGDDTSDTTAAGDGDDASGELGQNALAIEGFDFVLQPVEAGAEVSFENRDTASHTITADDGTFDSGTVAAGESTTFTAPEAGSYAVFCVIHPDITGTLEVQ